MEEKLPMANKPNRKEHTFIATTAVGIGLLVGLTQWRQRRAIQPMIEFPPSPPMPSPNALDFYREAGKLHKELLANNPDAFLVDPVTDTDFLEELTDQQLAERYPIAAKEAWLLKNGTVLAILREGFTHPLQWPMGSDYVDYIQDADIFTMARGLARLLRIEGNVRAEQGDWVGMSHSLLDIMHLGYDMVRSKTLISALVGYSVNGIAYKGLYALIPHLDAPSARSVASRIEELQQKRLSYSDVMVGEKWLALRHCQKLLSVSNWRSQWVQDKCSFGNEPVTWLERTHYIMSQPKLLIVSKHEIQENIIRALDEMIAELRKPYALRNRELASLKSFPGSEFYPFFVADFNAARSDAHAAILQVMLTLQAFKQEHHDYPEQLTELVADYLKNVPADPFGSGEPLRYRRTAESYLLYSIGPDSKDGGGTPIFNDGFTESSFWRQRQHRVFATSQGDIVAGVNL
jgi:hypothetical protein